MNRFEAIGARRAILAGVAVIVLVSTQPTSADAAPLRRANAGSHATAAADLAGTCGIGGDGESQEDVLYDEMRLLVCIHDIAVLAGVAPFPTISWAAEVAEFASNLALKTLPARLFAPPDLYANPNGPAGPGYSVDGCGIEFQLLSPQGSYSNLFGFWNIRDPYLQTNPLRSYPWQLSAGSADPNAETRWGFLRAPDLYHANTDARIEIRTPYEVRRYDPDTGLLEAPRRPIDTSAESPQLVYLPIGEHGIEWHAITEKNKLFDVGIPAVMLAFNTLSELKNIYGGAKAAKLARNSGIGQEVAEQAPDPQELARLYEGVKKFNAVWQKAFEDRHARKAARPAAKAVQELLGRFRGKVSEMVVETLVLDILPTLAERGITTLDGGSSEAIVPIVGRPKAAVMQVVWEVYNTRYPSASQAVSLSFIRDTLANNVLTIIRELLARHGVVAILDLLSVDTATNVKLQKITVWDSQPPTIDIDPAPVVVEATDFGGTRLARIRAQLAELVADSASDNCGRTPELILSGPELLRLGAQQVTWTARDRGPNPTDDGQDYSPTAVQNILVRDTQPPLLLAPPSKVILDTAPVPLADAAIGDAAAIDLVDVQPQVTNDAPASFPVNARTTVQWAARDSSGNEAQATQLVTVKDSNTPPMANVTTAATLTAQPVDIRLTAHDVDELDGRFDPLWFRIESPPSRGEFVAPLYPFFIEDYRTRPNDGLGQDYDPTTDEIHAYIGQNFCDRNLAPPRNFVHNALYVHVTDDGIRYVLDDFFVCDPDVNGADTERRFSKWTRDGEFLGQLQIGTNPEDWPMGDAFRVDRDGFLYYNNDLEPGSSSNELYLWKCPVDWEGRDNLTNANCARAYGFDSSSAPGNAVDARSLAYARIDSRLDVAYVADGHSLLAFEIIDTGGTRFLGEIGPKDEAGAVLDQWFGEITSLEVGSDGALYANDADWHRIHKLAPITRDENGELVLGEYVGWAGKCTGSGNNACEADPANPANGRSRGYSCTYAPDSCTVAAVERAGARQGQFNTPRYVALDPNDILYVADYQNLRIQRLSPDGSFAGEAVSSGSGINQGDRPSFILGNMGEPASVAVNSTQFFVVDRDEHFVHVFGTLPFKDITDDAATVTYVSDQDFPNPATMADDQFSFSVTDGLERSAPATVTVTVSRNFRRPEALSETVTTAEDASVHFTLPARDPDGIIGKDFLGLDTLTYTLTRWPENGTLSGYGDSWTYTPHPDFHGEDSLAFQVNDGREDSEEGTLTFAVTPVNDPPVVTLEVPERVALGFPTRVSATFTDDRVDTISEAVPDGHTDGYNGTASWGDGTHDTTGEFTNENDEVGTTGVTVIAPATADSEGRALAEHTYETAGPRTVQACVVDDGGLAACSSSTLEVESLVSLGAAGIFYDEPLPEDEVTLQEIPDGTDFTFEATLVNGRPSVGDGLPAADVRLDIELPAGLEIRDIAIERGSCTREGVAVSCALGTLEPGSEVRLAMIARGPGNLVYDADQEFEGTLHTSSDALEPDVGLFATVTLVADRTDSDGDGMSNTFERTHGLNPAADDGGADADGDGLSNLDEYRAGSSPRAADTDGDGRNDGAEIEADGDPLVDDVAPLLAAPADIEVNATGALTQVDLGTTGAVDFKDGPVAAVANRTGPFPPGPNVVTWSAVDETGNRADAYQFINVVPMVSFPVDQFVFEGDTARVRVELNGPAVNYPVRVPFVVSGTAASPGDHDGASGEVVITSGLSADIRIRVARDAGVEPNETIVLNMGTPVNAVAGARSMHTLTVTELNRPPRVLIGVEQHGRATTTIVSSAGLIALLATVRDDPAQGHAFDWSASDGALVDPVAVHDPGYLFDPSGLAAGLYDMRVTVADDGVAPLASTASSLLRVTNEPLLLRGNEDTDGDGLSDAAEGPWDSDGDRVADYLDDLPNSNLLRLGADGRLLEILAGLGLRLGASAFLQGGAYATVKEGDLGTDVPFGYSSDVPDFEVTGLEPGESTQVVIPLAHPVSDGAVYRVHAGGQWQDFIEDAGDGAATAPGENGACPPPANASYAPGLTAPHGCLQLTLTDGGPNDTDGVADGTIRIIGGLAVPVSAGMRGMAQPRTVLSGDGEAVMARTRLHSDSGDALVRSLTLQARGIEDDRKVDDVVLVHDTNRDGEWDDDDVVLARQRYAADNGSLTLQLDEPLELPVGDTDLLVIYVFGNVE